MKNNKTIVIYVHNAMLGDVSWRLTICWVKPMSLTLIKKMA